MAARSLGLFLRVCLLSSVLGVAVAACDDSTGSVAVSADKAMSALVARDVHIPQGWRFGQLDEDRVFTGSAGFFGRFDAPGDATDSRLPAADVLVRNVQQANPSFPPMVQAACRDLTLVGLRRGYLGFSCATGTTLFIATRTVSGQPGTPNQPDSETLLLTHDGVSAHLFVALQGH